jgi:hypothetical protein
MVANCSISTNHRAAFPSTNHFAVLEQTRLPYRKKMDYFLGTSTPAPASNSDRAKLRKVFDNINFEGSGALAKHELKLALQDMGMNNNDEIVNKMFAKADADGSGSISFEEFEKICTSKRDSFSAYAFANLAGFEMKSFGLELPSVFGNLEPEPIVEAKKVQPKQAPDLARVPGRGHTPPRGPPPAGGVDSTANGGHHPPGTPLDAFTKNPVTAAAGVATPKAVVQPEAEAPKPHHLQNKKSADTLTKQEIFEAETIFKRIDFDGSG